MKYLVEPSEIIENIDNGTHHNDRCEDNWLLSLSLFSSGCSGITVSSDLHDLPSHACFSPVLYIRISHVIGYPQA